MFIYFLYERFNATKGYTRTDKVANANECASPERKRVQGVRDIQATKAYTLSYEMDKK